MLTFLITLLVSAASLVLAQNSTNITISTLPTFSTCRPAQIEWSGGESPYRVYIYPSDWTNLTDWLIELPLTTRTSSTWNVNFEAGFGIVINIWDGVNDEYSDPAWIQDSGDISCLAVENNGTSSSVSDGASSTSESVSGTTRSQSRANPSIATTPGAGTAAPSITRTQEAPSSAGFTYSTITVTQSQASGLPNGALGMNEFGGRIWCFFIVSAMGAMGAVIDRIL